jgi:hypothetical protein
LSSRIEAQVGIYARPWRALARNATHLRCLLLHLRGRYGMKTLAYGVQKGSRARASIASCVSGPKNGPGPADAVGFPDGPNAPDPWLNSAIIKPLQLGSPATGAGLLAGL